MTKFLCKIHFCNLSYKVSALLKKRGHFNVNYIETKISYQFRV